MPDRAPRPALRGDPAASHPVVLVTGATGTLGSQVVAALRGKAVVRALVRDPARARTRLGDSVALVEGDLSDPASLRPAVAGADRAFLLCPHGNRQAAQAAAVAAAARSSGVRHIVFLSSAAAADPTAPLGAAHRAAEQALGESGVAWTSLRPTMTAQSLVEIAGRFLRPDDTVALPLGRARFNPVDTRDVAAAAASLLLADAFGAPAYLLTGPSSISGDEFAAELGVARGRTITYSDLPLADLGPVLAAAGAPPETVEHATALFEYFRSGGLDLTTDSVERLTGRAPRSLATCLADFLADDRRERPETAGIAAVPGH